MLPDLLIGSEAVFAEANREYGFVKKIRPAEPVKILSQWRKT
jgi:hypothetical protein